MTLGEYMPDVCAEKSMWIVGGVLAYNMLAKSYSALPTYVFMGIPMHDAAIGLGVDVYCRGVDFGSTRSAIAHATNALVGVGTGCAAKAANFL